MIFQNRLLDRRTLLRGTGAAMALPLLDAMLPSSATAAEAMVAKVKRFQVFYTPNGMIMDSFRPTTSGANYELTPTLEPLAPYRDRFTVFTNVAHGQADALGDGSGDHARACATFLTGVHIRKTEGSNVTAAISMDQILANKIGAETQFASLETGIDMPSLVGSCDTGYSCSYTNTLSWSSPTTPLPVTINPRELFERLFGDASLDAKSRTAQLRLRSSILDFVSEDVNRLSGKLGATDRLKIAEYLDSVRSIEARIQKAELNTTQFAGPQISMPSGIPADFQEHVKLMVDLQIMAMQADLTRVATFMLGREANARSYPEIGISEAFHPMSHHGNDPAKMAKLALINKANMGHFAYMMQRMIETKDGAGSLLDSTLLLGGASLGDSNRHDHRDLPLIVAGGLTPGGRHVALPKDTPMTNLLVSIMEAMGVKQEKFGDSTGPLPQLYA